MVRIDIDFTIIVFAARDRWIKLVISQSEARNDQRRLKQIKSADMNSCLPILNLSVMDSSLADR